MGTSTHETLLDKARQNLEVARLIEQNINSGSGDEALINYAGYHLQQAAELAIKYQLELSGVEYPKSHDIDELLDLADMNGVDLGDDEFLRTHSEQLTLWESRTRYILNYRLAAKKVETAIEEIAKYVDSIQDSI